MAKFGLFDGSNTKLSQEFEGEKMIQSGDHVQIVVGQGVHRKALAAIRLAPGQSVKQLES